MSGATGNFTSAGTWKTVDATSYNNTETTTRALTTSYQLSTAFTPGAITIDGIAVKLSVRTGTTGTITVSLYNNTLASTVAATEVAINCSDLPVASTAGLDGGWITFSFSSVLLLAANSYSVQAKTSSSSQVSLFSTATTNWARCLRTTTTAAPAAGDDLIICGEHTGAATGNTFTVTMNETAATDYGAASTSLVTPALAICKRGVLIYGVTASTNYVLRISGNAIVYSAGELDIGTVGSEMPRNSSAVLEFDCGADGEYGLTVRNGGTCVAQGLSRTSGKNIDSCLLNTNEAAAQTTLGVDTDTGWLSGDEIGIAPTGRTTTEFEKRVLNADAGASSVVVTSGLTYAHSGTSPTQAEVVLLTRNVRIRSTLSSAGTFINCKATSIVNFDWVEFYYIGTSTVLKRGIEFETVTGSFNMDYCSIHDTRFNGLTCNSVAVGTINNLVLYNISIVSSGTISYALYLPSSGACTVTNVTAIGFSGPSYTATMYLTFSSASTVLTNLNCSGGTGNGLIFGSNNSTTLTADPGINYLNIHSNGSSGLSLGYLKNATLSNAKIWRNNSAGIVFSPGTAGVNNIIFDTFLLFGNLSHNILQYPGVNLLLANSTLSGDSSFSTGSGITFQGSGSNIICENTTFGVASGIFVSHFSADLSVNTPLISPKVNLRNCLLASYTEIGNPTYVGLNGIISSQKHDQTAGNHKSWVAGGIISIDTSDYKTASPSEKLAPSSSTLKLESSSKYYAVDSGSTVTPITWICRSGTYNGNLPRLILKKNVAAGISADATLYTTVNTLSNGTFTGAATGWTLGTGWAYSSNTVVKNVDGTGTLSQSCGATAGVVFVVEYTISNWTVGTVTPSVGGVSGSAVGANGTYRDTITCSGAGALTFTPTNTSRFTIDNVKLWEKATGTTASVTDNAVLQFVVDCDGTAGQINVDDWT